MNVCFVVFRKQYFDVTSHQMVMDIDCPADLSDPRLHINCGMNLATVKEGATALFSCHMCNCPTVPTGVDRRDSGLGRTSSVGNCIEFDAA